MDIFRRSSTNLGLDEVNATNAQNSENLAQNLFYRKLVKINNKTQTRHSGESRCDVSELLLFKRKLVLLCKKSYKEFLSRLKIYFLILLQFWAKNGIMSSNGS